MLSHLPTPRSFPSCVCFAWRQKLHKAHKQIHLLSKWAYIDALTGLHNPRYLEQRFKKEIARAHREQSPLSVLMMDLDEFGKLNKEFGHLRVNEALKQVAGALQKCIRPSDGMIRYGGDEFVALLPNMDTEAAIQTAKRIQAQIHSLTPPFPVPKRLSMTIGIATYPQPGMTKESLLEAADQALRKGKVQGKNQIQIASSS